MNNFESDKDKDGLEDFFNKNLYDGSMQPSKSPWENIETALDLEEKEKKRKRFFWLFFSGVVLLIGTTATWVVLSNDTPSSPISSNTPQPKIRESETINKTQENQSIQESQEIAKKVESQNSNYNSNTAEIKNESKNSSDVVKIQLGAFSKKVNTDRFKNIPFDVQSEKAKDGITRYFITTTNVSSDLETIKQAGFKDAFIKRQDNSTSARAIHTINKSHTADLSDTKNSSTNSEEPKENIKAIALESETSPALTDTKKSQKAVASSSFINSSNNQTASLKKNSINSSAESTNISTSNNTSQNQPSTNVAQTAEKSSQNTNSVSEVKSNDIALTSTISNSITDSVPKKDPSVESKHDSIIPIAKADSVIKATKEPIKKDSVKLIPDYRWAISLIGGPNIYLNQAKTQLFDSKTEKQATTYGGEIKAEYTFIKGLSASIGIGYQSHSIQKDSTRFKFSKYITGDYLVNSSFGQMAIDNTTLMQGFFMIAPVDSFFAAYKYKSTIQSVNVPLQLNWYFLNKSRIKLYSSVGINANYIISQQSHLTLIKEHSVDDFYYKSIQTNKLNGILLLSLGCDVRLTKRLYFTVAPSYRYALTNFSPVSGIVFKPSYISATGGFKVRF